MTPPAQGEKRSDFLFTDLIKVIFTTIAKGFTSDDKRERGILRFIGILVIITLIISVLFSFFNDNKKILNILSAIVTVISITVLLSFFALNRIQVEKDNIKKEKIIGKAESILEQNPNETKAAWTIAKAKIETYIENNIKQVTSSFNVCVILIVIGFIMIVSGIVSVYLQNDANGSMLIIVAGVIVDFIGATVLIVLKNVFNQSKDYLIALERINAVGMCLQVIELIEEKKESTKKDKVKANIAKRILSMYSDK